MNKIEKQSVDRYAMVEGCDGCPDMRQDGKGSWVDYQDYAALSAQLTASLEAHGEQERYLWEAENAHATGKAEGLRAAALRVVSRKDGSVLHSPSSDLSDAHDAILGLIPADTPAAKVTVTAQEAARVLLADDGTVEDLAIQTMRNNRLIDGKRIGYYPALLAALRAIAGGQHD
jgi:hypothetical protein